MDIKKQIEKLQSLPDKHKKIILWAIVIVLATAMLFFWFNLAKKRVANLGKTIENIKLPQTEIPNNENNQTPNQ